MSKKMLVAMFLFCTLFTLSQAQFGYQDHEVEHNLVFPHIVLGSGYELSVILMNPGISESISGTLSFYDQSGTPLEVNYQNGMHSSLPVSLNEGATLILELSGAGEELTVGWAILEIDEEENSQTDHHGGEVVNPAGTAAGTMFSEPSFIPISQVRI